MGVSLPSPEVAERVAAGPYGVEMEVSIDGFLTVMGYDWSESVGFAEFLVSLGVDPQTASRAKAEAQFSAANKALEG